MPQLARSRVCSPCQQRGLGQNHPGLQPSARKRPHLRLRGFAHKPAMPMPFYAPYAESQSHQRALHSACRSWRALAFARLASSGAWARITPACSRVPESDPTCVCAALRTSRRCRCLSMHHTLNRNRTNARCTPRAAAGALSRLLALPAAGLGPESPRLAAECQKATPPAFARLCAQAGDADAFLCTIR